MSRATNNIGVIYNSQADQRTAESWFLKALHLSLDSEDVESRQLAARNLWSLYQDQNRTNSTKIALMASLATVDSATLEVAALTLQMEFEARHRSADIALATAHQAAEKLAGVTTSTYFLNLTISLVDFYISILAFDQGLDIAEQGLDRARKEENAMHISLYQLLTDTIFDSLAANAGRTRLCKQCRSGGSGGQLPTPLPLGPLHSHWQWIVTMIIRSTGFDYAVLFVVLLLGWPLMLINTPLLFGVGLGINTLVLAVVVYATSSPKVSFWKGLRLLPNRYMSGCVNITIVYIFFVLAYHYCWTVGAVASRLHRGRSHSQTWWVNHICHHTNLTRQELEQLKFPAWPGSARQLGLQVLAYSLLTLAILTVTYFIFAR